MSHCVDGKLILANLNTLETAEKTVVETYVRKVDKLVHLTINGEEIVTTDNHPFYVQGRGFIEAGSLLIGDKLVSANVKNLVIEDYNVEITKVPVSVYISEWTIFSLNFYSYYGKYVIIANSS